MHFLISNDDGYLAEGLSVLREALLPFGRVSAVAPMRDQSGKSQSLTLNAPIQLRHVDDGIYCVDGTPADCMHIALTDLFAHDLPDMVLTGINHGANLGDDTLYSGTVGAATEGFLRGIPSLALSMPGKGSYAWDTAKQVLHQLLVQHMSHWLAHPCLLNINIPNVPIDQIAGTKEAYLGQRHRPNPAIAIESPRGQPFYWIGDLGQALLLPESDFLAIHEHYVSITPLTLDLTDMNRIKQGVLCPNT